MRNPNGTYSELYWLTGKNKREYFQMFFKSPLTKVDSPVPDTIGELFNIYSRHEGCAHNDAITAIMFSNWVSQKMREDHGIGLLFPTKEMLALVFVVDQVFGMGNNFRRNFKTQELEGDWISPEITKAKKQAEEFARTTKWKEFIPKKDTEK